jgi:hypothetical protein
MASRDNRLKAFCEVLLSSSVPGGYLSPTRFFWLVRRGDGILGHICLGIEEMGSSRKILLAENACGSDEKARVN